VKPNKAKLPPPRVRHEPPTIAEAYLAAQGLTDDLDQQVTIAAGLIGQPEDEVRPYLPKPLPVSARAPVDSLMVRNRVVTVERRGGMSGLRPALPGAKISLGARSR
jgi:hypothetical protein